MERAGAESFTLMQGNAVRHSPLLGFPECACSASGGVRTQRLRCRYQRLLVMAASFLIIHQYRQPANKPMAPSELEATKERLISVLSDPNLTLQSVAAALCGLVGTSTPDLEQKVTGTLMSLLVRSSGGFKALAGGLKKALSVLLVMGPRAPAPDVRQLVKTLLSRMGGSFLTDDVIELAGVMGAIVGVSEAVHEGFYRRLVEG